jgi:hemolysin activation/secretion protein
MSSELINQSAVKLDTGSNRGLNSKLNLGRDFWKRSIAKVLFSSMSLLGLALLIPDHTQALPEVAPLTPSIQIKKAEPLLENLPENLPKSVVVSKFQIIGSTIFSEAELDRLTEQFINRPLSFNQLFEVRSAITQLYLDRGYITSGAFLPIQTFSDRGEVVIQVLEGSLEDIQIKGTNRLNPEYIKSRLALAATKPLNRDRLVQALQLLQLNPLIAKVSAELSSSLEPGLNLLTVNLTEASSFRLGLSTDNRRSPSVGSDRQQIELKEGNLLGWGDSLTLAYGRSEGSNSFDFSYDLPLNASNTSLTFAFNRTNSRVIETPFNQIDLIAASRSYDLSLRQPLLQTANQEFVTGLTLSHRQSETALLDTPFPISPGADSQGRTLVSALRWFQEFNQRGVQEVLALRSQFSLGIGILNATINPEPPDSQFFSWRGQAQYVNQFAADTLLLLRGDLQLSDRRLVPIEQIGIGGQESVRGYRQDFLLADNGATINLELRLPVLRGAQGVLQVVPFADFGVAWNHNVNASSVFGLGLGLRWQQGNNLTVRFDYGIPFNKVATSGRSLQENGVYFSIDWQPF